MSIISIRTHRSHGFPYITHGREPMTMRLAFVTSEAEAALTTDDHLAVAALVARGVTAVWTAPAFLAWLDRVEATGVPVVNPPSILRWNSTKRYLHTLAQQGTAQVVPTELVESGDPRSLATVFAW